MFLCVSCAQCSHKLFALIKCVYAWRHEFHEKSLGIVWTKPNVSNELVESNEIKKRMKAGEERKTLRGVSWWQNNTYHCVHAKWLVSSISLNIIRLSQSSFIRTCIRMKYKFVRTYGEIAKKAMMVKELESECNFWRVWQRMENKTDAAMIGNVIEMCANASCQSIFSISHSLFRIE